MTQDLCRDEFEKLYQFAADCRDGDGYQDVRIMRVQLKHLWDGWRAAWDTNSRKTIPWVGMLDEIIQAMEDAGWQHPELRKDYELKGICAARNLRTQIQGCSHGE